MKQKKAVCGEVIQLLFKGYPNYRYNTSFFDIDFPKYSSTTI